MLNTSRGTPVAMIDGGENDGKIIYVDEKCTKDNGFDEIDLLEGGTVRPFMDFINERCVCFLGGPAGSGKSTFAINLIKDYLKLFPETEFYLFSRTDGRKDPAFKGVKINQIKLDESILENPIDIEKELGSRKSILFFDDCGTIINDDVRKYVEKLMMDIMEVGRRLQINIIITNHLINPNDRKFGRVLLNEMQFFCCFPRSGSSYQIRYCLKNYFGLSKKQIDHIMKLPSRWVYISKKYPMTVMSEKGIYIL
jgi:hypothetical protein